MGRVSTVSSGKKMKPEHAAKKICIEEDSRQIPEEVIIEEDSRQIPEEETIEENSRQIPEEETIEENSQPPIIGFEPEDCGDFFSKLFYELITYGFYDCLRSQLEDFF